MANNVHGQTSILPREIEYNSKGVIYKTENAVNLTLHTNGFRLGYDKGRIKTYYKTTYYHFDIGYLRHTKEIRQSVNFQTNLDINNSFTYGKQNSLYVLRGGLGGKRYLSEKARRKGIAVGYNYEFGAALGMIKPYYLVFLERVDGERVIFEEKYTEDFEETFLDINKIQGRGSWFKGWDELKFAPGIQGKVGAHFSLGAFERYVTAVEVGLMADIFFQRIPLMVVENNKPYFLNFYITLQLGRRQ